MLQRGGFFPRERDPINSAKRANLRKSEVSGQPLQRHARMRFAVGEVRQAAMR